MKKQLLYSCEHIVLGIKHYSTINTMIITTISTDAKIVSPYLEVPVKLSEEVCFGSLGKYIKTPEGFSWQNLKNYGKHKYEIVEVIDIAGTDLIIYGENIGEDTIHNFKSRAKVIEKKSERPESCYYFYPQPEHKLLVKKSTALGVAKYEVVHNITFAKRKYLIDQHVI